MVAADKSATWGGRISHIAPNYMLDELIWPLGDTCEERGSGGVGRELMAYSRWARTSTRDAGGDRWRRKPYYGWVLVVTLGLTTIISYGTTQYLFGVLVVPIDQELGWDRASLSGAYSLMLVLALRTGWRIGRHTCTTAKRCLSSASASFGKRSRTRWGPDHSV